MDQWEVNHIVNNKQRLASKTRVHCSLLSRFGAGFLAPVDCEQLEAIGTLKGDTAKATAFYDILLKNDKPGTYQFLIDALVEETQSGAAGILKEAMEYTRQQQIAEAGYNLN